MDKTPKSNKLTKRSIDTFPHTGGRSIVWDSDLAGFGLPIESSGTKTFIVRYRAGSGGRNAQQRFMTLGRYGVLTPEEARKSAKDVLADVAKGKDPVIENLPYHLVNQKQIVLSAQYHMCIVTRKCEQ